MAWLRHNLRQDRELCFYRMSVYFSGPQFSSDRGKSGPRIAWPNTTFLIGGNRGKKGSWSNSPSSWGQKKDSHIFQRIRIIFVQEYCSSQVVEKKLHRFIWTGYMSKTESKKKVRLKKAKKPGHLEIFFRNKCAFHTMSCQSREKLENSDIEKSWRKRWNLFPSEWPAL